MKALVKGSRKLKEIDKSRYVDYKVSELQLNIEQKPSHSRKGSHGLPEIKNSKLYFSLININDSFIQIQSVLGLS